MIEELELEPQVKTWQVAEKPKIKVLCLSIWYPLSMSRYFERAFRRRDDIDFIAAGSYTGSNIPWMGGLNLLEKYAKVPELPLPFPPNVNKISYDFVKAQLPKDWIPDLVLAIDAGVNWTSKPQDGLVATIATDPHCLNYDHQRKISDKFFNMQLCYSQQGDIYLPYAYDKEIHYPIFAEKQYDACLIGLQYENRNRLVNRLRQRGLSVLYETGIVYDEFRVAYNQSRAALSWSSLLDLPARVWEAFALCVPLVTNRVPDLQNFFLEGDHYLGFDTVDEAEHQVMTLLNDPECATEMADRAYRKVEFHTWDQRVEQILATCKLI